MAAAEDTAEDAPRKGKSNAILTYELLAEFDRKLTKVSERFEASMERQNDRDKDLADHEARLRAVERDIIAIIAGTTSGKNWAGHAWTVFVFLFGAAVSIIGIFVGAYRIH